MKCLYITAENGTITIMQKLMAGLHFPSQLFVLNIHLALTIQMSLTKITKHAMNVSFELKSISTCAQVVTHSYGYLKYIMIGNSNGIGND